MRSPRRKSLPHKAKIYFSSEELLSMFFFEADWKSLFLLLLLCPLPVFLYLLSKNFSSPELQVSDLSAFPSAQKSFKERCEHLPGLLFVLALCLFLLAFVDPRIYQKRQES